VVDDRHRNQGLGSMLMEHLMEAARARGISRIEGEVLGENHRMLSLMRELGLRGAHLRHRPRHPRRGAQDLRKTRRG